MMKFTLSKGEGERTFLAAGAHYRYTSYESYQITGTWGPPSEDGRIPVELKITYRRAGWLNRDVKGVFDPEENSLRGTTSEKSWGGLVFKRDPDFVRFCPGPHATDACHRWRFVKTVILDRVRRQAWSSKQILKRLKDRKRLIELALKKQEGSVTRDEIKESQNLTFGLREEDVRFYTSIIIVRLSKTIRFPYVAVPEFYTLAILTIMNIFLLKRGHLLQLWLHPRRIEDYLYRLLRRQDDREPLFETRMCQLHGCIRRRR